MNNIKALQAPAIIFLLGYGFQYIDHYHRAILSHGYNLALLAVAVYATLYVVRGSGKQHEQQAQKPTLIEHEPQQTINLHEHVREKARQA
jgi:hypothetical protein